MRIKRKDGALREITQPNCKFRCESNAMQKMKRQIVPVQLGLVKELHASLEIHRKKSARSVNAIIGANQIDSELNTPNKTGQNKKYP